MEERRYYCRDHKKSVRVYPNGSEALVLCRNYDDEGHECSLRNSECLGLEYVARKSAPAMKHSGKIRRK